MQQLVEEGLISVIHVPGSIVGEGTAYGINGSGNDTLRLKGFCVDAMTKPLAAPLIKAYYAQLHGPVKW